jgi:hypothetical protein
MAEGTPYTLSITVVERDDGRLRKTGVARGDLRITQKHLQMAASSLTGRAEFQTASRYLKSPEGK